MKFSTKDFSGDQIRSFLPQFSADLVTFTEEILNVKRYFLCSVCTQFSFLTMVSYLSLISVDCSRTTHGSCRFATVSITYLLQHPIKMGLGTKLDNIFDMSIATIHKF